jgi:nuclear pore complex protein Nup98-Nup96
LFGQTPQQQQTGGFGAATGGFGATSNTTTGGGLFGQKPATGGLFGSTTNTGTTGGGLFGSNTGTTGGFGTTGTTTGTGAFGTGGAFGAANQNKPATGFSFGGTSTATPTTGGFGTTTGTGFGQTNTATTGGGMFGQQPQQQPQQQQTSAFGSQPASTGFGGGAFGQNTQQQQQPSTGFGGFGGQQQQQQKPAFGGFGTTTTTPATGGGLFGNQQQNQQTQQQQTQTGGLFGSKPAFGAATTTGTTGGGLFGNNNQTQQTGGLFGSAQPASTNTGGLFGTQNNTATTGTGGGLFGPTQQSKPGGLFSGSTTQNQGGVMFGGLNTANNQATGSSLFGTQQPQQQQQQGGGLFGNTLGMGQQNQQQQQFTTSISDSPYGNAALLGSFAASTQNQQLGPIATPLNASQNKKAAMIPHHKIAPRQPALTPRLGTSFSRSGSPFASSTSGAAPLGSGGNLRQSLSTNKLSLFDADDTVLNANAFSSGTSRVASLKKLVIDKKIKDQDLFNDGSEPRARPEAITNGRATNGNQRGILKKTVSFDVNEKRNEDLFSSPGSNDTPARPTSGPAPSSDELGYIRRTPERKPATDVDESPGSTPRPSQGESAASNEMALVPASKEDDKHGAYWMVPSAHKLKSLTHEQRKKVHGLTVGRRGFGSVRFEHPVDITEIECKIEEIPGKLVIFEPRVCTVYPEEMVKPAPGTGLNVPALISLEECFPLTKNTREKIVDPEHPRYITHIKRLRSIKDTEFIDYQPQSGLWIFKVRHFTTYGLVDDDDEAMGEEDAHYEDDVSYVTEEGQTPTPRPAIVTPASLLIDDYNMDADISGISGLSGMDSTSGLDDTFDFKRIQKPLARMPARDQHPGSFLDETDASYEYDVEEGDVTEGDVTMDGEPFLGEGSVGSIEEEEEPAEPASEDEAVEDEGQLTVIVEDDEETAGIVDDTPSKQLMLMSPERSPAKSVGATPKALPMGRDWTEQLNNTISPVKRRFGGESFFAAGDKSASPRKSTIEPLNYGLLDLANDLYGSPTKLNGTVRKDMSKTRKRDQFEV